MEELYTIITSRKLVKQKNSYTVSLLTGRKDRIIQKVGEEAVETIIAAKNKSKKRVIEEVADLLYHLFVLLSFFEIKITDIEKELEKRNTKRFIG